MDLLKFYMGESFDAYEYFGGSTKRSMRRSIPNAIPAFSGMLFSVRG